ncbi:hypothetical protein [Thermoanaerobacterium sp. RBIITD]|uniref:hypothetical protein n=1 Tax=Thermoanaerobacterium sp. RBIITD TaxID=1550240 RepID=UPI000BB7240D|nr:hypothetical protein [Thermoanaerobacterium sp. RBIITD]
MDIYKNIKSRIPEVIRYTYKSLELADEDTERYFYVKNMTDDIVIIKPDMRDMKWYKFNLAEECIKRGSTATLDKINTILEILS